MDINSIINIFSYNKFAQSIFILISFFIISKLIVYISEKIILKITAKTSTNVDDLIVEKTSKPISFLLLIIGTRLAIIPHASLLTEKAMGIINSTISSFLFITVGFIIIKIANIIIDEWGRKFAQKTKTKIDDSIVSLFHKIINIIAFIILILLILELWGIKIGPLLASLGIAGLAVAFALQPTLSNVFGGISMILDKTVRIGDVVQLDSGEKGTVHDIGIRSTKIKTWDNELIVVPNGKLVDSRVQNFSMPDLSTRINIEFGVEYGSDVEQVKKLAIDTVTKLDDTLKDPEPRILFLDMADFALKFKVMFWVDDLSKKWPTHQEAITNLYNNLNKAGIGIPFPTSTVYLKKE